MRKPERIIPWKQIDPLLAIKPTRLLVERFGVDSKTLWTRRMELGIPNPGKIDFTEFPDLDRLLLEGELADKNLARRFGISPTVVRRRREQLGAPPSPARIPKAWRAGLRDAIDAALRKGEYTVDIMRRFGVYESLVVRRRKEL